MNLFSYLGFNIRSKEDWSQAFCNQYLVNILAFRRIIRMTIVEILRRFAFFSSAILLIKLIFAFFYSAIYDFFGCHSHSFIPHFFLPQTFSSLKVWRNFDYLTILNISVRASPFFPCVDLVNLIKNKTKHLALEDSILINVAMKKESRTKI